MGKVMYMRKGDVHSAPPIPGIAASDISTGSTVKLLENGVAVEYMVVNNGKPSGSSLYDDSCDGIWLLRKQGAGLRAWHSAANNVYASSDVHAYLNGDFLSRFNAATLSAIKQVKIPYGAGGSTSTVKSGANGLSAKVFLISTYEVGFTTSNDSTIPVDGAKLDYFTAGTATAANDKRIMYYNNVADYWWLRSPTTNSSSNAWRIGSVGTRGNNAVTGQNCIRPALIIPKTAVFDETTLILKGVN